MAGLIEKLHWLGHAAFVVRNGKTVYFDPYKIAGGPKADLILISHEHFDHCSPEDVRKIVKPSTVIVTVSAGRPKLAALTGQFAEVQTVKPGDSIRVEEVAIEAVPAYNLDKKFHPKASQWVGFVVTLDDERLYHSGDTDAIPEMSAIRCDIALLPVSGTYVMTAEEAARAAAVLKPKIAVPMHYGDIVGTGEDARRFQSLSACTVRILPKE